MNLSAEQFAEQAQLFSTFAGLTKPKSGDKFFLVMGITGSGKSTFISRCTGKKVGVGHGLHSCTNSIDIFDFFNHGGRIFLIDTPGFNDTNRSDTEALETLATYLGASYANGVRIHGVLMLHPISDNRVSGSSLRNIEMIRAICGDAFLDKFLIATTMWPESPDNDETRRLERRETELIVDDRFFGAFIARGSALFRHNESGRLNAVEEIASARRIVANLIERSDSSRPAILQLQREIIDEGKSLHQTTAGIVVDRELHLARRAHEDHLRKLEAELQTQVALSNATYAKELQELKADVMKKLRKSEEERQVLKQSMQDLHKKEEQVWKKELRLVEQKFRQRIEKKEEELQDMEESLREMRKEVAERAKRRRRQKKMLKKQASEEREAPKTENKQSQELIPRREDDFQIEKYEKMVNQSRGEVEQERGAYKKFQGQKGNVINGLTNGLAAGTTGGIIAAAVAGGMLCSVM